MDVPEMNKISGFTNISFLRVNSMTLVACFKMIRGYKLLSALGILQGIVFIRYHSVISHYFTTGARNGTAMKILMNIISE